MKLSLAIAALLSVASAQRHENGECIPDWVPEKSEYDSMFKVVGGKCSVDGAYEWGDRSKNVRKEVKTTGECLKACADWKECESADYMRTYGNNDPYISCTLIPYVRIGQNKDRCTTKHKCYSKIHAEADEDLSELVQEKEEAKYNHKLAAKTCIDRFEFTGKLNVKQQAVIKACVMKMKGNHKMIWGKCAKKLNIELPASKADKMKIQACFKQTRGGWAKCHQTCKKAAKLSQPMFKVSQEKRASIMKCTKKCAQLKKAINQKKNKTEFVF